MSPISTNPLGPVVMDLEGLSLTAEDIQLLQHPLVGGVILFARNYTDPAQLSALIYSIRSVRKNILIAVDHEGGRVQRFKTGFTRIPPMQVFHSLYDHHPERALSLCADVGWLLAAELLAFEIDISFAPVLDVDESFSSIIGDRAFSPDPDRVSELAYAFIEGMNEAGMKCTGKHFPGHGSVRADSHLELPVDTRTYSEVEQKDLVPFMRLNNHLDALMPAHIVFPDVDSEPVGFSKKWLKHILRIELNYKGVIFSDDLSMEGATVVGGYPDRAFAALDAGCDVVLVCNNRAGTKEVLAALDKRNYPSSDKLAAMRGNWGVSFDELKLSDRWQRTHAFLQTLSSN